MPLFRDSFRSGHVFPARSVYAEVVQRSVMEPPKFGSSNCALWARRGRGPFSGECDCPADPRHRRSAGTTDGDGAAVRVCLPCPSSPPVPSSPVPLPSRPRRCGLSSGRPITRPRPPIIILRRVITRRWGTTMGRRRGEPRTPVEAGAAGSNLGPLDKAAPPESLSLDGQERVQRTRDPGRPSA